MSAEVAKEYRFSVVMYGGVSLAIYMNGVAQELLHLVRSTARDASNKQFRFCDPCAPGATAENILRATEPVYRRLARSLNEAGENDVRFIVDTISGTSAGGINGIFLAKALSDDSLNFDVLQNLWIEEGALEKLLNDKQTWDDTKLPRQDFPKSLLCSDRMYIKLLTALSQMKKNKVPGGTGLPYCEEIDLFATTTDITGRVVPLRLADMLVWERKYKEDFHFRFNHATGRNDLHEKNDAFIAFVARCTSSFPFAFEPMQLRKVKDLRQTAAWPGSQKPDDSAFAHWQKKFFDHPQDEVPTGDDLTRAFGDGGYLNNKPFSFVVESLGRHASAYPTERKLIYVEPAPEHPELEAGSDETAAAKNTNAPNALVNSYDALMKLPGYQPIHDDLQRVIERNRLVRKVNELSRIITDTIRQKEDAPSPAGNGQATERSVADFSYVVLRAYSTTDQLAKVLSEWFKYNPSSSYYYAIRCLVRAWRELMYEIKAKPPGDRMALVAVYNQFLSAYDIEFAKRKYRFIRQAINLLYCYDTVARKQLKSFGVSDADLADPYFRKGFRDKLGELKKPFDDASLTIGEAQRKIRPGAQDSSSDASLTALSTCFRNLQREVDAFKANDPQHRSIVQVVLGVPPVDLKRPQASLQADQSEEYAPRAVRLLAQNPALRDAVDATASAMSAILQTAVNQAENQSASGLTQLRQLANVEALPDNAASRGVRQAFRVAQFFAAHFEEFDTGTFPLLYDSDVGTPEPIGIIRVSPDDSRQIYDQSQPGAAEKLAGASLFHFGAFLDRSFRTNDILWGRLDGAERIIRALLGPDDPQAASLIDEAQLIIIQDYLENRKGELGTLVYEISKSLSNVPENHRVSAIQNAVKDAFATLPSQAFAQVAEAICTPQKIRESLQQGPPPRDPDRRSSLESVTRSMRIVGGILEGMGKETQKTGAFLARLGAALWWLVEAAVPGGLTGHWVRYLFALLFWLEVVMVVGGTFFNQSVQTLGLKLLGITAALWLVKDAFQRFILEGKKGVRVTGVLAALAVLVLVVLWAVQLNRHSLYLGPQAIIELWHKLRREM